MRSPVAVGVALALGAAVAFGAATPVIGALGRDVGPFTVAALLYAGAAAMLVGGVLLGVATLTRAGLDVLGLAAVVLATVAWAGDNTVSRALSEVEPSDVVLAKGLLGAGLTGGIAAVLGEPLPLPVIATGLVGCGATGYGLSLRLYLLAQRRMGAGRTASVFAVAPVLGAVLAVALGEQSGGVPVAIAAGLFALGVYLHVTERHAHAHTHAALGHEHAHAHDDAHHDHTHDPPVTGEHTHWHEHAEREHTHDHAPDLHHDHRHA